jgi:hypothetical protein
MTEPVDIPARSLPDNVQTVAVMIECDALRGRLQHSQNARDYRLAGN